MTLNQVTSTLCLNVSLMYLLHVTWLLVLLEMTHSFQRSILSLAPLFFNCFCIYTYIICSANKVITYSLPHCLRALSAGDRQSVGREGSGQFWGQTPDALHAGMYWRKDSCAFVVALQKLFKQIVLSPEFQHDSLCQSIWSINNVTVLLIPVIFKSETFFCTNMKCLVDYNQTLKYRWVSPVWPFCSSVAAFMFVMQEEAHEAVCPFNTVIFFAVC